MTVTVTVPVNPPKKISNTVTSATTLTVHNGAILGWGKGFILNKAGKATITVPISGYGSITFTANFSRNTSTGVTTVTGTLTGSFPSADSMDLFKNPPILQEANLRTLSD